MADQMLRNPDGKLLATIRTQTDGKQRIYTPNGTCRGEYKPASDSTHNMNGTMIGRGNLLVTLL